MLPEDAKQIDDAIEAHVQWISRLRSAVAKRASDYSPATVRHDNLCAFGRWMYRGVPSAPRGSAAFEEIRAAHATFHERAAAILELALAGRTVEADRLMEPTGEFMTLSGRLVLKLKALKNGA